MSLHRYPQCSDRMCGADDCPNCHPENFRGGEYIELDDLEKSQWNFPELAEEEDEPWEVAPSDRNGAFRND